MKDIFDEQDFYELMQRYRHTKLADINGVNKSFEDIKSFIKKEIEYESTEFALLVVKNLKKNKNKNINKLYKEFKKL